jgi:hypothetical protein
MLAEEPSHPRRGIQAHAVIGELAGLVSVVLVPELVGQVLDEVAAASDVEQLRAPADRQDGHVAFERGLEEAELGLVAGRAW